MLSYFPDRYFPDRFGLGPQRLPQKEVDSMLSYFSDRWGKKYKEAVDLLEQVGSILDKLSAQWFITGGLILGWLRFNDILPWDDDLDIFAPVSQRYDDLTKAFTNAGLRYYRAERSLIVFSLSGSPAGDFCHTGVWGCRDNCPWANCLEYFSGLYQCPSGGHISCGGYSGKCCFVICDG